MGMPWLNEKAPYNSILRHIKERGIRVFHRQMKNGVGGLFDCRQTIITIDKESRETWAGCYLLLHEYYHSQQYRDGKFLLFFETILEDTEYNRKMVLEAEFGAVNGAVSLLKQWGIKYTTNEIENPEEAKKFWLNHYFGQKKCNKGN